MSGYRPGLTRADIALFEAASQGRLDGVLQALRDGADPGAIDAEGQTPLHALALATSRFEPAPAEDARAIAQALIAAGADVEAADARGRSPLQAAARRHSVLAAAILADLGARLSGSLCEAAESAGGAGMLAFLLSRGADPFELDSRGRSPLRLAQSAWGRPDPACVALLEAAELNASAPARSPSPSPSSSSPRL